MTAILQVGSFPCFSLSSHPRLVFKLLSFLLVILTTSRNHEDKPKNTAIYEGGQGLVVLRVFSSPYGPGMFPVPRLQRCLFLTLFL